MEATTAMCLKCVYRFLFFETKLLCYKICNVVIRLLLFTIMWFSMMFYSILAYPTKFELNLTSEESCMSNPLLYEPQYLNLLKRFFLEWNTDVLILTKKAFRLNFVPTFLSKRREEKINEHLVKPQIRMFVAVIRSFNLFNLKTS